jgi:hypothetical protein
LKSFGQVVLTISAWPAFIHLSSKGAFSRTLTLTDFLFAFLWMIGTFLLLLFWVFPRAKDDGANAQYFR